jgi:hypothetical protein
MPTLAARSDDDVDLPTIDRFIVDQFVEMLVEDTGALRPPINAAELLAVICALSKDNRPFPGREAMAEHIGCALSTIDAALSTRLAEGYISQIIETSAGNVARRNSVIRRTYYRPSKRLMDTYDKAASQVKVSRSRPPRKPGRKPRRKAATRKNIPATPTKDT